MTMIVLAVGESSKLFKVSKLRFWLFTEVFELTEFRFSSLRLKFPKLDLRREIPPIMFKPKFLTLEKGLASKLDCVLYVTVLMRMSEEVVSPSLALPMLILGTGKLFTEMCVLNSDSAERRLSEGALW